MEFDDLFEFDGDLFDDEAVEEGKENKIKLNSVADFWVLGEKGFDVVEAQEKFDFSSLRFNCSEDSADEEIKNSIFVKDLKDVLNERAYMMPEDNSLFNYSFNEDLPVDVLIRIARTTIQKIASSIVDSTGQRASSSFFAMRQNVTHFLLTLRCDYQNLKWEHFEFISGTLLISLTLQVWRSSAASCCLGNFWFNARIIINPIFIMCRRKFIEIFSLPPVAWSAWVAMDLSVDNL